jgi:uncharacterized protein (UPF0333 family)
MTDQIYKSYESWIKQVCNYLVKVNNRGITVSAGNKHNSYYNSNKHHAISMTSDGLLFEQTNLLTQHNKTEYLNVRRK